MLKEWGHIPPCYCYRCPFGLRYPECNVDCADELDRVLERDGSKDVAAFIFEPVSGATLGAVAPRRRLRATPRGNLPPSRDFIDRR